MKQATFFIVFFLPHSLLIHGLLSRDCGTWGPLFQVSEASLLEVITQRLQKLEKAGRIQRLQQIWQDKTKARLENPTLVRGVNKTKKARITFYDPSISISDDLKDHRGQIFHKKGELFNPLSQFSLPAPLLFINGRDKDQVAWALGQAGKIILTAGKPFELMDLHDRRMFVDQLGIMTKKLDIRSVPARITQEDLRLKVEEVAL